MKSQQEIEEVLGLNGNETLEQLLAVLQSYITVTDTEINNMKNISVQTLPTVVRNQEKLVKGRIHSPSTNDVQGMPSILNKRIVILKLVLDKLISNFSEELTAYVSYVSQTKTTAQKQVARTNIGLENVENKVMDDTPTENSENYVKSGGVKTYVDNAIGNEVSNRNNAIDSASSSLQNKINAEKTAREEADNLLVENLNAEITARQQANNSLQSNINSEANARQQADLTLQDNIDSEVSAREQAINNLDEKITKLEGIQNVIDIVGTYQALQAYDKTKLELNDAIQVMADETQTDRPSTVYRWNKSTWVYEGMFGGNSYTKSVVDAKLAEKVNKNDISNNLTTNDETKVLSAKQGKVLNEKIGDVEDDVEEIQEKLNGISDEANKTEGSSTNGNILIDGQETNVYVLPKANQSTLGGIKKGNGLNIDEYGVASVNKAEINLDNVQNTSDSDIPVQNGKQKFTTGGAYIELNKKADKTTTYTKTEVDNLLSAKQNNLTFDEYPTQNSNNPVKSKGIYHDLNEKQDKAYSLMVNNTTYTTIENILVALNAYINTLNSAIGSITGEGDSTLASELAQLKSEWQVFMTSTSADNVIDTLNEINIALTNLNTDTSEMEEAIEALQSELTNTPIVETGQSLEYTAQAVKYGTVDIIGGNSVKYAPSTPSDDTTALVKTMPSVVYDFDVNKIKGASVKYNQLYDYSGLSSVSANGGTITNNNDGSFTLSTESGGATANVSLQRWFTLTQNHKYLFCGISVLKNKGCILSVASGGDSLDDNAIFNFTSATTSLATTIRINSGTILSSPITIFPMCFDLTAIFGAGNEPSDVATAKAQLLTLGINIDEYNTYSTGEIRNLELTSVDVEGSNLRNLPNNTLSQQGAIINRTLVNLPRGTYYISFDWTGGGDMAVICENSSLQIINTLTLSGLSSGRNGGTFTITQEAVYIRAYSNNSGGGTISNIMLNNGSTALSYVDYVQPTIIPIDLTSIEDSGGNKLFADGSLKGVGNVYDEVTPYKATKRMGIVDLELLSWTLGTGNAWMANNTIGMKESPVSVVYEGAFKSSKYDLSAATGGGIWVANTITCLNQTTAQLRINNGSTTDKPSGYLLYELADPIEADIDFSFLKNIQGYSNGSIIAQNTYDMPVSSEIRYNSIIKDTLVDSIDIDNGGGDTSSVDLTDYTIEEDGWSVSNDVFNYRAFREGNRHKRVGRVDLGSLNYGTGYGTNLFNVSLSGVKPSTINLLSAIYTPTDNWNTFINNDLMAHISSGGMLILHNNSYTSASDFKTAMSGVYLYFELAEEVVENLNIPYDISFLPLNNGDKIRFNNTFNQPVNYQLSFSTTMKALITLNYENDKMQQKAIDKNTEEIEDLKDDIEGIGNGTNINSFADVESALQGKQPTIADLEDIREGATAGATAVQDNDYNHTDNNYTDLEKDKLEDIEENAERNIFNEIQLEGQKINPVNRVINIVLPKDVGVDLAYNNSNGVLSLLDKNGNVLGSVDLALELLVSTGYYDVNSHKIILVLANNTVSNPSTIEIPVGDLVDVYVGDNTNISITNNVVYLTASFLNRISSIETSLTNKVDKVSGKGLSTNDYTTAEKNKLAGIASGAEVNVQSDWSQSNTSADDYIKNKPTVPTSLSQLTEDSTHRFVSDSEKTAWNGKSNFSGSYTDLTNKPDYLPMTVIDNEYKYIYFDVNTNNEYLLIPFDNGANISLYAEQYNSSTDGWDRYAIPSSSIQYTIKGFTTIRMVNWGVLVYSEGNQLSRSLNLSSGTWRLSIEVPNGNHWGIIKLNPAKDIVNN